MEGSNQKNLAEDSIRNNAAITRTLNSLEEKGLVKRKKSPDDKREFLIYLTKKRRSIKNNNKNNNKNNKTSIVTWPVFFAGI